MSRAMAVTNGRGRSAMHQAKRFPYDEMLAKLGKKDARSQRIAYYLDWAARAYPYQFQPYNIVAQQIGGLRSLPRKESPESKNVQGTISAARKILQATYDRNCDTAAGGMRASVNTDDQTEMSKKQVSRLRSGKDSFLRATSIIDPKSIKDPKLKAYYHQNIAPIMKVIGSEDFAKRLMPPTSDE